MNQPTRNRLILAGKLAIMYLGAAILGYFLLLREVSGKGPYLEIGFVELGSTRGEHGVRNMLVTILSCLVQVRYRMLVLEALGLSLASGIQPDPAGQLWPPTLISSSWHDACGRLPTPRC